MISEHLPANSDVEALAWANLTHTGGKLAVADSGGCLKF